MTDAEMCAFEHFLIEVCPLLQTYSIPLFPHDGSISVIMKTPRYERTLGAFIFPFNGTLEDLQRSYKRLFEFFLFFVKTQSRITK